MVEGARQGAVGVGLGRRSRAFCSTPSTASDELATRDDQFRTRWATHDFREHRTGLKRVHHPIVGDLDLTFEPMDLTSDRLQLLAFSAVPAPRPTTDSGCWPPGQPRSRSIPVTADTTTSIDTRPGRSIDSKPSPA